MYVYMYVYVCIYVCLCMYICMFMYVYMYIRKCRWNYNLKPSTTEVKIRFRFLKSIFLFFKLYLVKLFKDVA